MMLASTAVNAWQKRGIHPVFAGLQRLEPPRSDGDPYESEGGISNGGSHSSNLSISSLTDAQVQPRVRNRFSCPDRGNPRPHRWRGHRKRSRWSGDAVFKEHAGGKLCAGLISDAAFYLNPVALPELISGVGNALLQCPVGCEYQQSLRIIIQPTGGTEIGRMNELRQGYPGRMGAISICELTEHTERLVEENNRRHSHSVTDLMLKWRLSHTALHAPPTVWRRRAWGVSVIVAKCVISGEFQHGIPTHPSTHLW